LAKGDDDAEHHEATDFTRSEISGFVNRLPELQDLDRFLTADPAQPAIGRISLIAGTAGVGKTSLAVHWAHRVRRHFPDGQLYVNLRGYDPGVPLKPAQALEHLLSALYIPPAAVPADLDARASLFRSRTVPFVTDPTTPHGDPACVATVTHCSG
jgi:Cdc6-like AAA superfamily ATPase